MGRQGAVAGLILLFLAGCANVPPLSEPAPPEAPQALAPYGGEVSSQRMPPPDKDFSTAIDPDHGGIPDGHALAALHAHDFGLTLVGYNPLTRTLEGGMPWQNHGFIAIDVWTRYACVAHWAGAGGATVVDIQDPAKPVVLSTVDSGMVNSDCQFTDDGDFLLLGSYTGIGGGQPLPPPVGDAAAQGVLVYDVRDKAQPRFLFHDAQSAGPDGYHNLFTAKIGGVNYVFQTFTGRILALDPGATKLRPVSKVPAAVHDVWVGHHPVTGDWTMITGSGGDGTVLYDVSDPAKPERLGAWEAHDGYTGWHRQWPLAQTVEGRALLVVAGEDCSLGASPSLPYTVLDFTDPEDLLELGHWQIPGKPVSPLPPNFCSMSAHEFETWDGYVATGNYHAGLWLFDIGTLARAREPVTLGYYLPHEVPATGLGTTNHPFINNPYVWGGYFDDRGYVLAPDYGSGLYVLKFDATRT